MRKLFVLFFLFIAQVVWAQQPKIELLTNGIKTNLRGLSVAGNTIWASGSNGKIALSKDGGNTWQWRTVRGFEQKDFRDIEALDNHTAIIIAIDTPAYILKTTDTGNSWQIKYRDNRKGMFLDAMDFCNNKNGIVVGDPIDGKIFLARTQNGGETWQPFICNTSKEILPGEAFFAASGSNIVMKNKDKFFLVSGGTQARIFTPNNVYRLPIMQGSSTSGANALALYKNKITVVGGDFNQPERRDSTAVIFLNKDKKSISPMSMPFGYRSDVVFITKKILIACGLTGIDISYNGGKTWKNISLHSFNTCAYDKQSNTVFFAGQNGTIAKLEW